MTIGWSGGGPHALACSALLPGGACHCPHRQRRPLYEAVELHGDWYENDEGYRAALAGDFDGLPGLCDEVASQHVDEQAVDMPGWFTSEVDKAASTGEYAEWFAAGIRSAFASADAGLYDEGCLLSPLGL